MPWTSETSTPNGSGWPTARTWQAHRVLPRNPFRLQPWDAFAIGYPKIGFRMTVPGDPPDVDEREVVAAKKMMPSDPLYDSK